MLKTRQLRGHRVDRRVVTAAEDYFTLAEIVAAKTVGVAPEMVGQYVFEQRVLGKLGPGEIRLEGFALVSDDGPPIYRLWGTHRA